MTAKLKKATPKLPYCLEKTNIALIHVVILLPLTPTLFLTHYYASKYFDITCTKCCCVELSNVCLQQKKFNVDENDPIEIEQI